MYRAKYAMVISLCVVLATACNDGQSVSAPESGVRTTLVPPATGGVSASALRNIMFDKAPGLCLGAANGTNANGTPVTTAACSGAAGQQFTLDTTGAVRVFGDKCLDAAMGTAQNGDKVQIWTCNGYKQQRWSLTAAGQLVGVGGKCVDVAMGSTAPGAKVQLWTCYAGSANQKWRTNGLTVAPAPTQPAVPVSVSTSGSAGSGGAAELPRVYLNTAMPAVTGRTLSVPAGGDLQGALNAAQPGDQVVLAAGATYVGNFVLPAKAGMTSTQWITVRTSGSLPAEGTRVGPGDAAQMPKLLTPNSDPALSTATATQGWRLVGLEFGPAPRASLTYAFVAFGNAGSNQNTLAQVPSRLVLDRSYVHGSAQYNVRRCVVLNSAASALIDSYLADCHSNDSDSQAILGWNGPGPYKVVNNHLEGGHEVVMFGGSDPSIPNNVPADVEIRRNHIVRPTSWRGVWQAKNLLELKMGQRVLVEGNVFENNWVDAQNGFAFVFNSNNQDGGCPWCITSDVTFRSNVVRNTPHGFNLGAHGSNGATNPSLAMRRVTITNNVVTGVAEQNGRMFQIGGDIAGITITNNTAVGGSSDVYFITPDQSLPTFVFSNNITGGTYMLFGDGGFSGTTSLARLAIPAANVQGNVFVASSNPSLIPSGNVFAASVGAVGFASYTTGDMTLSTASSFISAGAGKSIPGANMVALSSATAGVAR